MTDKTNKNELTTDAAAALLLKSENEFRRSLKKKCWKFFLWFSACALSLAIVFLIAGFFSENIGILLYIPVGIISLWLICGVAILYIIPARTTRHFSEKILPGICKMLDPELEYSADDGIPIADYRSSGFFPVRCKGYRYCDLITGSYHGRKLSFSNFQSICEREITKTNGKTKNVEHVLFSGIFLTCGPMDRVNANILVLPSAGYEKLAELLMDASSPMLKLKPPVSLQGTQEFQKEFVVFSHDETAAKTFMTLERCGKIYTLSQKLNAPVYVSFAPERTCVAVGKSLDLTASSFWFPMENEEIKKIYDELEQILRIPESL